MTIRRSYSLALPGALACAGLLLASPASAQTRSLSWSESSQVEVPGALGLLLRAAGVSNSTSPMQSIHLQGSVLIEGDEDAVVIMDVGRRHWISVDHRERSYTRVSFDDFAQMSREAIQELRSAGAAARAEAGGGAPEAAQLEVRISSERTGQRRDFGNGIGGVQHLLSAELATAAAPEGVDDAEGGAILFLTELWQTSDVPSADALMAAWTQQLASDPAFRSLSEELAANVASGPTGLDAALGSWNPEVGAGLIQLSEAMSSVEGTTVQSVTTIALVPDGVDVNRAELLAWSPESMGDRLRSGASSAAREAAGAAARSAVQGLSRGLLGGRRGGDEPAAEPAAAAEAPGVRPLLRITNTKQNFRYEESSRDIAGELYTLIESYREIPSEERFGQ